MYRIFVTNLYIGRTVDMSEAIDLRRKFKMARLTSEQNEFSPSIFPRSSYPFYVLCVTILDSASATIVVSVV